MKNILNTLIIFVAIWLLIFPVIGVALAVILGAVMMMAYTFKIMFLNK